MLSLILIKNYLISVTANQESKECTSTDDFSPFPKLCELIFTSFQLLINFHVVVKPTLHKVLNQLACIDASWRKIGYGLGVSYNKLQGLAQTTHDDLIKLSDVIQKWIEMDGKDDGAPVTWITILDVLKGPLVKNKNLAMKMYQSLKEEGTNEQIGHSKYTIDSWCWYINFFSLDAVNSCDSHVLKL